MNGIFFLIPFLLIVSIGIFQDTFALETYRGYDYQTVKNPDGTNTWTGGLTPWVFDGNNYVPFLFDDTTKKVTTEYGEVKLNADGSYSFYKNGNLKFTDKIVAKYADISNLNSWTYPNTLNNDTPDISWNGTAFTSSKVKSAVGQLDYIFANNDGSWKTQLEATNLSGLTTKAFGFDEIVDLESDTIKFGGISRNLDNFNNTTFDKQFLTNNQGKIIEFLNGIHFDFDKGFENLYSITVIDTGANKSRLIFDYRTSDPLLPGETLMIDPTWGYTAGTVRTILDTGCNGTADSENTNGYVGANSGPTVCYKSAYYFDITTLPDTATITAVNFRSDTTEIYDAAATSCPVRSIAGNPSTMTIQQLLDDILAGTLYTTLTTECRVVANNYVISPAGFVADLQAELAVDNEWGIGIYGTNYSDLQLARIVVPELEVTYTEGSPANPVTSVTYANLSTNSVDIIWDAPNDFGSGTFLNYVFNYTTPWGAPLTFVANTTNTYYNMTGLTFGTDYSFRIAAATTSGLYNTTGSYILNVTTTSTSYSLPPTSLVATSNSATQIDLQWVASAMQNILGYKIERETPSGTGWATIVSNTTNTNVYYNNTGLTSNIIYNYRVSALNGTGISTPSNTYEMTTYHLPDAVTDLTGSATDLSTIDLSWTAPTSYAPAITGYMINGTTPTGEPVDILNSNTGTTATTATALNLLIGQEYSFRVSPITVHGKNASGNIWNGSTIQTFVIGNLSNPDITNDDDFSIFFDRTDVNASAIQLDVTYPNSYDLSCDFDYKYARTNQTYSGLTTVPDGADDQVATFTLINATGDLVQVTCWDTITGDESIYVITITNFPFLEQVNSLRNGDYGTFFQIGAFDGVMLIVIFLGMVGLNRTTPIVGVIFVVIAVFTMQYFGFITYPIIMYPAMVMMIVWAFVSTRKDD